MLFLDRAIIERYGLVLRIWFWHENLAVMTQLSPMSETEACCLSWRRSVVFYSMVFPLLAPVVVKCQFAADACYFCWERYTSACS